MPSPRRRAPASASTAWTRAVWGRGLDETIDIGGVPLDDPDSGASVLSITRAVAPRTICCDVEETGGFAIVNQNDLNASSSVSSRTTAATTSSGTTLERQAGRQVPQGASTRHAPRPSRPARAGYSAPKGRAATPDTRRTPERRFLRKSGMRSPARSRQRTGFCRIPAPFTGPSKSSVALVVEFDKATLTFANRTGRSSPTSNCTCWRLTPLEIAGRWEPLPLRLSAPSHQAVTANGFRVTPPLTLPPGRYQIRVGAKEMNGRRRGNGDPVARRPDFPRGRFN